MTCNTLGSMTTHRHGLGVVVLEGPLYAVGGHDGEIDLQFRLLFGIFSDQMFFLILLFNLGWSYLNTVERYFNDEKLLF